MLVANLWLLTGEGYPMELAYNQTTVIILSFWFRSGQISWLFFFYHHASYRQVCVKANHQRGTALIPTAKNFQPQFTDDQWENNPFCLRYQTCGKYLVHKFSPPQLDDPQYLSTAVKIRVILKKCVHDHQDFRTPKKCPINGALRMILILWRKDILVINCSWHGVVESPFKGLPTDPPPSTPLSYNISCFKNQLRD